MLPTQFGKTANELNHRSIAFATGSRVVPRRAHACCSRRHYCAYCRAEHDFAPVGLPDQRFGFVSTPSINALGQVTFASYLVSGSSLTYDSIWTEAGDNGLHLVARGGLSPSDISDGTTFNTFLPQSGGILFSKKYGDPFSNAEGTVAFQASASTGSGVWTENAGISRTVAISTQPVPELPGREHLWIYGPPVMNANGDVLFESHVGSKTNSNDYNSGLFAAGATSPPRLVAGGLGPNSNAGDLAGNTGSFFIPHAFDICRNSVCAQRCRTNRIYRESQPAHRPKPPGGFFEALAE